MFVDKAGAAAVAVAQNKSNEESTGASFKDFMLAAAQSGKKSDSAPEEISEERRIYEDILGTGFTNWVQDMRKEEMEKKIRERVLSSMGLTEEELAKMPAEQKAAIEKLIQDYIQQAMAAKGTDKAQEKQSKGQAYVPVLPGAL